MAQAPRPPDSALQVREEGDEEEGAAAEGEAEQLRKKGGLRRPPAPAPRSPRPQALTATRAVPQRSLSLVLGARKAPAPPQQPQQPAGTQQAPADNTPAPAAATPPQPPRQRTATNTSIFKRSTLVDRLFGRKGTKQNASPLVHSTSHPNLGKSGNTSLDSVSSSNDSLEHRPKTSPGPSGSAPDMDGGVDPAAATTARSHESINHKTRDSGFANGGSSSRQQQQGQDQVQQLKAPAPDTSPPQHEPVDPADPRLATDAEFVATLLFENRHPLYPKTQFSFVLAKTAEFNKRVLAAYMARFEFAGLTLDAAFRKLCAHLYLTGETQAVDRILMAFAKKYFSDSDETHVWLSDDIVYAILFSIVLLNTDLYMTTSDQVKTMKKMSRREFSNNTLTLVEDLKSDLEAKCGALSKTDARKWKKEIKARLRLIYESIKNNRILQRQMSAGGLNIGAPGAGGSSKDGLLTGSRNAAEMRSKILNSSGSRQVSSSHPVGDDSLVSTPSEGSIAFEANPDESVNLPPSESVGSDQLKGLFTSITKDPHKKWGKAQLAGIGHAINAHRRTGSGLPVMNPEGFRALHPAKPLIFSSQISRKLKYEKAGEKSRDKRWCVCDAFLCLDADRGVELVCFSEDKKENISLGLLHGYAEALPLPGYKDSREHVFSLRLNAGGMFLFDASTPELVAQWVREINYYAAIRSKEPLRGGVSNAEFGWGPLVRELSDRALDEALRTTRVIEWIVPGGGMIVSPLGVKDQLASMRRQTAYVAGEIREHQDARALIEKRLAPRAGAFKLAIANWHRKAEYLERELQKYTTYVASIEERHPASLHSAAGVGVAAGGSSSEASRKSNTSLQPQVGGPEPSEKSSIVGAAAGSMIAGPAVAYGTHLAPEDAVVPPPLSNAPARRTPGEAMRDFDRLFPNGPGAGAGGDANQPAPLRPAASRASELSAEGFQLAASRLEIAASRGSGGGNGFAGPSTEEVFLSARSEFSVNRQGSDGGGGGEFQSPRSSEAGSDYAAAAGAGAPQAGHARQRSRMSSGRGSVQEGARVAGEDQGSSSAGEGARRK